MKIDDHFIACCSHSVFSCFFMFSVGEPPWFLDISWISHDNPGSVQNDPTGRFGRGPEAAAVGDTGDTGRWGLRDVKGKDRGKRKLCMILYD